MQHAMKAKIFLDYDADELNLQYDQRAWAANAEAVINRCGVASDAVCARLGEPEVMTYGASPAETVDIYRSREPDAPIHVFFHGGAWRALSKPDRAGADGIRWQVTPKMLALPAPRGGDGRRTAACNTKIFLGCTCKYFVLRRHSRAI